MRRWKLRGGELLPAALGLATEELERLGGGMVSLVKWQVYVSLVAIGMPYIRVPHDLSSPLSMA